MKDKTSEKVPAADIRAGKKQPMRSNIEIVLVEPQGAGNIGSVARGMKNTGFRNLVLVNPCEFHNNEAYSMACKADDVLLGARVVEDLGTYLATADILVGTTRRMGRIRYPVLTLQEATSKIVELASSNRVSILFGREDRGLRNEDLPLCDILVQIPTDDECPSINLSHAVFLVCYQLYAATSLKGPTIEVAPRHEIEKMYVHLEEALRALEYGEMGGEHLLATILRSFRRLFGRTGLMPKEVNMLRGIFTQIQSRTRPKGGGGKV